MYDSGTQLNRSGLFSCKRSSPTITTVTVSDLWLDRSGEARVTVFASSNKARSFNFQAGDVGYIPPSFGQDYFMIAFEITLIFVGTLGHYVENTGNTTLKFLEIFKSRKSLLVHIGRISILRDEHFHRPMPRHFFDSMASIDAAKSCEGPSWLF